MNLPGMQTSSAPTTPNRFNHHNLKIMHKGLILALVAPCLGVVFVCILFFLHGEAEKEVRREATAADIQYRTSELGQLIFEAGSVISSYSFTRQEIFLKRYQEIIAQSKENFDRLRELVRDHPDQVKMLDRMNELEAKTWVLLDQLKTDPRDSETQFELFKIKKLRTDAQRLMHVFVNEMYAFRNAQSESLHGGKSYDPELYRKILRGLLILGALSTIPLGWLLVRFLSNSITGRLNVVMDNALKLAAGRPLNPVIEGGDEIARLDSMFHDMAAVLADATARERAVVDNALDLICCLDSGNKFIEVNPASQQVLGYAPDELLGRRLADIVIKDEIEKTLSRQKTAMETNSSIVYENKVAKVDGTVLDMLWAVHWSPEQKTFFCVAHDITERKAFENMLKESEARIQMIIESLPVALIISDPESGIESTNIRAEQMFGFKTSEIVGRQLNSLFQEWSNRKLARKSSGINLEDRLMERVGELEARRKDGSTLPVEVSITRFDYRNSPKLLMIALDVTERHEIEKWKQEFIQMVSHDLRTPLTSVKGSLSLFAIGKYGEMNGKGLDTVARCDADLSRLTALIDDLLDLEKFESGKMELEREVFDLSIIVERAISAVSYVANRSGIKIESSKDSVEGYGDGPKLIQVIVNLLSNALKFSPRGSTIKVVYEEHEGALEVRVADQGRGVPPAQKDSIFERFKQVESADHGVKGGKGLGLSICKTIVEAHGGTIGVESQEGKGSTFWFRIPLPE